MSNNISAPISNIVVQMPEEVWLQMKADLQEVKSLLQQKTEEEIKSQWVPSETAREMLGVSQRTWQRYRDNRIIPFSQYGRRIYVKMADLEAFMHKYQISASNVDIKQA